MLRPMVLYLPSISTHAPVRARLQPFANWLLAAIISTHAPVRARRSETAFPRPSIINFNSRAREGATRGKTPDVAGPAISTHAPVRARRFGHQNSLLTPRHFNSRAREGATPEPVAGIDEIRISTHAPVRARLLMFRYLAEFSIFQLTRP